MEVMVLIIKPGTDRGFMFSASTSMFFSSSIFNHVSIWKEIVDYAALRISQLGLKLYEHNENDICTRNIPLV